MRTQSIAVRNHQNVLARMRELDGTFVSTGVFHHAIFDTRESAGQFQRELVQAGYSLFTNLVGPPMDGRDYLISWRTVPARSSAGKACGRR